jgi:hypothetical protein
VDFWAKQENSRDRLVSGAVCVSVWIDGEGRECSFCTWRCTGRGGGCGGNADGVVSFWAERNGDAVDTLLMSFYGVSRRSTSFLLVSTGIR